MMVIARGLDNGRQDSDEDDDVGIVTSIGNGERTEWSAIQWVPLNCTTQSPITNWLFQQHNAGILVLEYLLM